jgi:hypothetical protein
MEKIRIRDKHPGSATLQKMFIHFLDNVYGQHGLKEILTKFQFVKNRKLTKVYRRNFPKQNVVGARRELAAGLGTHAQHWLQPTGKEVHQFSVK